jgi:predicted ATP-dependent protease
MVPIIIEDNPVPEKLFGSDGTDIMQIEAGSLLKSSGGLLLLNAEDLIEEEESWKLLKRVIRTGRTAIGTRAAGLIRNSLQDAGNQLILPEVEIDLKVIILGNEQHFDHFYNTDEDFRELFQFFAELDSVIELNDKTLSDTVNYLRNFSASITGCKLTDDAAFECVKFSIAASENKTKLSTITSEIELLIREASLTEPSAGDGRITAEQIKKAITNQSDRYSLLERRIIEDIKSGEINLQVDGSETGKVNGLAVIDKGSWSFGSPGLISVRIAPGENGLINIEHEAGLSGEIHDKWVLILEGFLRSRFAPDFPISIFASICFEQSYSEIDGDSASSSELYALLSAIADIPIRQDIAVTGSLSQTGQIQAVGGLREKIEGFYKACRAINYTGKQGVIVPERNIKNIILPDEIVDEINAGRFHIYPVSTVDDSMEILTGRESGNRNLLGQFPHGSLNNLIEKNLKKLASQAKNSGN